MKKIFLYLSMLALLVTMGACTQNDNFGEPEISIDPETFSSPPVLVTLKSGVVVEKKGDIYVMEGDIMLSPEQLKSLDETGSLYGEIPENPAPNIAVNPVTNLPYDRLETRNLGIYPTPYNLWAMARFTYNSSLTSTQRARIKAALLHIESLTNVRFYNATGQPTRDPNYGFDYPYIDFVPTGEQDVSSSYVGRIGGRQQISLANFAFYSWNTGVIIHEICHALGMLHEQSRPDRDNYVTVNYSNLTSQGSANFQKRTTNYYYIGSYDFESVMGYGSYTSSTSMVHNTSLPMYTKKDNSDITSGDGLSFNDRLWLNSLYIPYIARSDVYSELADVVYKENNVVMSASERLQLQAQLNNGNPYPPSSGRIPNDF
ncbi:MAG: M12 family metallopeptidase [Phocaeicola sp.]